MFTALKPVLVCQKDPKTSEEVVHKVMYPENEIFSKSFVYDSEGKLVSKSPSRSLMMKFKYTVVSEFVLNTLNDIEKMYAFAREHAYCCMVNTHMREIYKNNLETPVPRTMEFFEPRQNVKSKAISFDIDNWDINLLNLDRANVRACAQHVANLLTEIMPNIFPEGFGYYAHASSSCGVDTTGIRIHFHTINSVELSGGQVRQLFNTINKLVQEKFETKKEFADPSLYKSIQTLIMARPQFDPINKDPFHNKGKRDFVNKNGEYVHPINVIQSPTGKFYKGAHATEYTDAWYGEEVYLSDASFDCLVTGVECQVPEDYEAYISNTFKKLTSDKLNAVTRNLTGIQFDSKSILSVEELPTSIVKFIEGIETGKITDNMYQKHLHTVFFEAVAQGYDLDSFSKFIIEPVLRKYIIDNVKDKKHSIEAYLKNAIGFALSASVSQVSRAIGIDNMKKSYPEGVNYYEVPASPLGKLALPPTFPEAGKINFIKASLGTGKTFTVKKLLEQGRIGNNVIAITNRRSLVSSNAANLGLAHYKEFSFDTDLRGVSTTVHSLHKYYNAIKNNMFSAVFIDECDAVLDEVLNTTTLSEVTRIRILECLKLLFWNCEYVILTDGDMSTETVEAYWRLNHEKSKPINVYVTEVETHKNVCAFEFKQENAILGAMLSVASEGAPILVVTDYGPDAIRSISFILGRYLESIGMPEHNIIQIHAESLEDPDVREILDDSNPTEALIRSNVTAVITSPSVTSGIDFQGYFETVFCITTSNLNAPNIRMQAMCRERKPRCIMYYTGIDAEGAFVSKEIKALDDQELFEISFETGYRSETQKEFIKRLLNERNKYRFFIRYGLLSKGCKVEVFDVFPEYHEEWDYYSAMYKDEHTELYANQILHATPKSSGWRCNNIYDIKNQVSYYAGKRGLLDSLTREEVLDFLKDKPFRKAAMIHKLKSLPKFWVPFRDILLAKGTYPEKYRKLKDLYKDQIVRITANSVPINFKDPFRLVRSCGFIIDINTGVVNLDTSLSYYRLYLEYLGLEVPDDLLQPDEVKEQEMERLSDLHL